MIPADKQDKARFARLKRLQTAIDREQSPGGEPSGADLARLAGLLDEMQTLLAELRRTHTAIGREIGGSHASFNAASAYRRAGKL